MKNRKNINFYWVGEENGEESVSRIARTYYLKSSVFSYIYENTRRRKEQYVGDEREARKK